MKTDRIKSMAKYTQIRRNTLWMWCNVDGHLPLRKLFILRFFFSFEIKDGRKRKKKSLNNVNGRSFVVKSFSFFSASQFFYSIPSFSFWFLWSDALALTKMLRQSDNDFTGLFLFTVFLHISTNCWCILFKRKTYFAVNQPFSP